MRNHGLFEGSRTWGKHGVNVHKRPHLIGGAKVCNLGPQVLLIVEHFALAETDHAVRQDVKTLRRIIFVEDRRKHPLPWVGPGHCTRQRHSAVVAELKGTDGNVHNH